MLPRRWRRPPHSARTPGTPCWPLWRWPAPRAPPRRPAPAGGPGWPPGPCSCVTCTGSLSNCPLLTSSVECWGRGLGSNWCSERWLVAEYAGARQPGNLRPASQATRSRSAGIVSGGGGDTSIVWRLWSVSLFLIIPPNQSNPGQMWPPFRARSEGSRRFHTYREGRRPSPGWNTRHYQKALMLNRLLNMRSKCVIGIQT